VRFAVEARLSINGRRIDDAAWFASERECGFEGMYETKQDGLHKLPLVFAPQASTCLKAIIMLVTCAVTKDDLTLLILSPVHHRGHLRCEYEELGVDEHDQCDVTSGNVQASPARQ
jgi:hypothetical protein